MSGSYEWDGCRHLGHLLRLIIKNTYAVDVLHHSAMAGGTGIGKICVAEICRTDYADNIEVIAPTMLSYQTAHPQMKNDFSFHDIRLFCLSLLCKKNNLISIPQIAKITGPVQQCFSFFKSRISETAQHIPAKVVKAETAFRINWITMVLRRQQVGHSPIRPHCCTHQRRFVLHDEWHAE